VYGGTTNDTRVWSGTDGSCQGILESDPTAGVKALAVAEDGTLFVSDSNDHLIRAWSNGEHVRTLTGHTDHVAALAIGTQGRLYSASFDMTIRVWAVAHGTHLSTLAGHTHIILAVVVGLDGTVYSGSGDDTIRVWSGDDGRLLRTLPGHGSYVVSVAVDSGGTIFSRSNDNTIRIWCGATGTCCHVLMVPGSAGSFHSLAIGKDDKLYTFDQGETAITVW
jgi:WD40 repeat protein